MPLLFWAMLVIASTVFIGAAIGIVYDAMRKPIHECVNVRGMVIECNHNVNGE